MDRMFERAFNKVHGDVSKVQSDYIQQLDKAKQKAAQEDEADAGGAIQGILQCYKDKDYFKLLELPEPTADELGRPVWGCSAADVSRAYRRLSVLVHPDKHPGNDSARAAFEALNDTHRTLKDPARLEEVLKAAAHKARRAREALEARAATDSAARAAMVSAKNAAAKRLRSEQGASFDAEIRAQMKRRQEEAVRKAAALARARGSVLHAADGEDDNDDDEAAAGHHSHQSTKAAGYSSGGGNTGPHKPPAGAAPAAGSRAASSYNGKGDGRSEQKVGNNDSDDEEAARLKQKEAMAANAKRRKRTIMN